MSIKTILVYLPSEKNASVIAGQAVKIAAANSAHLIGFHLIPDLPVYGEFPAEISEDVVERLQKLGKDAAAASKTIFEEMAGASKVSHEWRCFTASYGLGVELIAQHGHAADLIVCGKADEDISDAWNDFAETSIMRSGRPVLIVPTDGRAPKEIGKHVVIAWNDTREAARAVFDSIELIREAETVRAVTMIEKETQRPAAECLGRNLIASLGRHGISASLDVCFASGGIKGEAILSKLLDDGCDLLVMGGYSHSRFREMIFGGVSRDVLRDTWVPTLVSH